MSALEEALAAQPTNLPCLVALAVTLGPQSLKHAACLKRRAPVGLGMSGFRGKGFRRDSEVKQAQVIDEEEFVDAFKGAAAFAAMVTTGGAAHRAMRC